MSRRRVEVSIPLKEIAPLLGLGKEIHVKSVSHDHDLDRIRVWLYSDSPNWQVLPPVAPGEVAYRMSLEELRALAATIP